MSDYSVTLVLSPELAAALDAHRQAQPELRTRRAEIMAIIWKAVRPPEAKAAPKIAPVKPKPPLATAAPVPPKRPRVSAPTLHRGPMRPAPAGSLLKETKK